ncbi:hypothetical protein [Brachybacterium paraconglomeratum]|uniref:hypothetical protein n=1 Tax=Brachybacterium paraconglomeratum TaxID=173362 RepID=UPI00174E6766
MESDQPSRPDAGTPPPTAGEARAVLDSLDTDAAQLASRLESPWWYNVTLGALVAAAISAQALPGIPGLTVIALVIIWLPFLVQAYSSRYRISMTRPAGPRSRRMLLLILAVLALLMGSGVALKLASMPPWWALVPASAGFVATVLLGRRYDAVLRSEITAPDSPAQR